MVELEEGRSQLVCLKKSRTSRRGDGVAKIEEGNTILDTLLKNMTTAGQSLF